MSQPLRELAGLFASLSFLTIGGVNAVLPEMQRQAVEVRHWMTVEQFAGLFALAQAVPGPNFMVATLVGFRVAGVGGAIVATLALIGPSGLLAYAVARVWHRFRAARLRVVLQMALTPVTVGLVLAAAILLARSVGTTPARGALTVAVAAAALASRRNPLLFLVAGAAVGAAGVLSP